MTTTNVMLAWPNRADGAGLDQGAWVPSLPLGNMQNPVLGIRARSVDALPASTQFRANLGTPRAARVVTLGNHNMSLPARYRLRAASEPAFATPIYDSGWLPVNPGPVDWSDPDTWLDWEEDDFWAGGISVDDVSGYRATLVHVLPAPVRAQYWWVELDDSSNDAGHVEIGRLFVGPAWQPVHNVSYGAGLGWVSRTDVAEAASGGEYFERRQAYRVFTGELAWMDTAEAMSRGFEFQRRLDLSGQFVFVYDGADALHKRRRAFLARLRQLTAIEHPYYDTHRMPVEIKEII